MISETAWRAEEAAINGFPPLRQVVVDGWMLRFSGGVRRTANSATPLRESSGDIGAVIAAAAKLYRGQNLPAIFRIPSFVAPAIDRQLAAHGYTAEGESCVIEGPLDAVVASGIAAGGAGELHLSLQPTPEWFAAMALLQAQRPAFHAGYRAIVGSVTLPAAFATLAADRKVVALAYGVIHQGMLCYESVVTDAAQRRRGHARRVLGGLAQWARQHGATRATLQVEADNTPARTLYHALGMTTELHRYHYRREPGTGPPA